MVRQTNAGLVLSSAEDGPDLLRPGQASPR